jgi:RNA polymerase sigma factor (sigma-70 family)
MEHARATEQSDQPIKSNPGTPHKRPFRVVSSDDGLLFDLLRQLGEIPYIKREDEEAYGRELTSCRLAFTDLVQGLPVTERAFVFGSHADPSMHQSREHVISCYQRLVQQATDYPESRSAGVLPRAKELKRRMDRAWNMLTRSHLRFVVKVAKEVGAGRMPLIDLVQEGAMGLMIAVDRYDPERGYRLMTYAYWWIKRSVTLAIENKSQVIRIPRSIRQRLFRLTMASSELRESLGRQPTQREIADERSRRRPRSQRDGPSR